MFLGHEESLVRKGKGESDRTGACGVAWRGCGHCMWRILSESGGGRESPSSGQRYYRLLFTPHKKSV